MTSSPKRSRSAPKARACVREGFEKEGVIAVEPVKEKTKEPTKFEAYYDFHEKAATIPSHRYLAIRRGESEGVLRASFEVDKPTLASKIGALAKVRAASPFAEQMRLAIDDSLARLLLPSVESDVRIALKLKADRDAVGVFAENLRKLLLAAPLGRRVVLGIDPGQRTGCKCVMVDDTGKLGENALLHLVHGDGAMATSKKTFLDLLNRFKPFAIAVGNGTHGRETADFCRDTLKEAGKEKDILIVLVSESGASVYSASDIAREEFPDLDLTIRGAVSIARRLQDPLAELVKVDPKAIGVGQYQHDVFQPLLMRKLNEVVESCVNAVGVELNMASAPLLERVAGVGPSLAKKIVKERDDNGPFRTRAELPGRVKGLGPKAYEQCAGFVRIRGGENPLDASAVHPERYSLVETIAKDAKVALAEAPPGKSDVVAEHRLGEVRLGRRGASPTPRGHREGAGEAGTRPARDLRAPHVPRRRPEDRGSEGRDGPRGGRDQRDRLRRLRGRRGPPGRPGPRQPAGRPLHQGPPRGGQGRRQGQSAGPGGRFGPKRIALTAKSARQGAGGGEKHPHIERWVTSR